MQEKRVYFSHKGIPWLFVGPQLVITIIFFIWPASQAVRQSFLLEDPFGLNTQFAGVDNFIALFRDPFYLQAFTNTLVFTLATVAASVSFALLLAVLADSVLKGAGAYKSFLVVPYAVAPPLAGVLWLFMFHPACGILTYALQGLGYQWNHVGNGSQAMFLVVAAAAWKQISYNFLFFLAGLQAIPKSFIESAAIDGAGPAKRFWTIIFPLLSPTTFFLLVINIIYAFFDTFGIIHAVTQGGPAKATETLIYKVFNDGFIGMDLGGSAAQSVILMIIVMALTVAQFRYVERRVNY